MIVFAVCALFYAPLESRSGSIVPGHWPCLFARFKQSLSRPARSRCWGRICPRRPVLALSAAMIRDAAMLLLARGGPPRIRPPRKARVCPSDAVNEGQNVRRSCEHRTFAVFRRSNAARAANEQSKQQGGRREGRAGVYRHAALGTRTSRTCTARADTPDNNGRGRQGRTQRADWETRRKGQEDADGRRRDGHRTPVHAMIQRRDGHNDIRTIKKHRQQRPARAQSTMRWRSEMKRWRSETER